MVRVLLAAGVDLRHVNNTGYTALDCAEEGRRKFDEVIALLEQKIAATAAPKAEASKGKGKGKGKELRRHEANTRPLNLIFFMKAINVRVNPGSIEA